MLTLDEIKDRLKGRNIQDVSKEIDVSASTLYRIAQGQEYDYKPETIERISTYFLEEAKELLKRHKKK